MTQQQGLARLILSTLTAVTVAVPMMNASVSAQQFPVHTPTDMITWYGQDRASAGSALVNSFCDYNGDGQGDILGSDWMWRRAGVGGIGTAYVIPSSAEEIPSGGDLDTPGSGAYRFEGAFDQNMSGFTVACAGDVNGDGFDDIAYSDFRGNQLSIFFGEQGVQTRSQQYLGEHGFLIEGLPGGRTSNASSGIGDLNGDGLDDIAVVTKNSGDEAAGRIDIVTGAKGIETVTLPVDPGEQHPRVLSTIVGASSEAALSNVSPAGDVNGDGLEDIVITGYTAVRPDHVAGTRAPGMAWVVFSEQDGLPRTIDLADLGHRGFEIAGPDRGGDRLGISAAAMGDINNDGFDDLLLGADSNGSTAGAGVVVLGSADNSTVHTDPEAERTVFSGDSYRGWWISGQTIGDNTGYAVAARPGGGEAHPLIILGAFNAGAGAEGAVYIIDALALATADSAPTVAELIASGEASVIKGTEAGQRLGRSVASIGDFDGDGIGDLAWGGDAVNAGRGVISLGLMPASDIPGLPAVPVASSSSIANFSS